MPPSIDIVLKLAQQVHGSTQVSLAVKQAVVTTLELWSRRVIIEIAQRVDIITATEDLHSLGHNPYPLPTFAKLDGVISLSTSDPTPSKILDSFDCVVEEDSQIQPFYSNGDLAARHQNLIATVHSIITDIPRTGTLDESKLRALYTTALEGYLFAGCMAFSMKLFDKSAFLNSVILLFAPNYAEALYNQATTMITAGHKQDAVFWWRMTLRAKPGYWAAAEQLSSVLMVESRPIEAGTTLCTCINATIAQDIAPNTLQSWQKLLSLYHTLGNNHYSHKKVGQAVQVFAQVVMLASLPDHLKLGPDQFSWSKVDAQKFMVNFALGKSTDLATSEIETLTETISNVMLAWYMEERDHVASVPVSTTSALLVSPKKAMRVRFKLYGDMGLPPLLLRLTLLQCPGIGRLTKDRESGYELASSDSDNGRVTVPPSVLPLFQSITITIANALLNLAKILQDGIHSGKTDHAISFNNRSPTLYDILSLYLLSLSLNPSASTANNIGILLNSLSTSMPNRNHVRSLALSYYQYGLSLDPKHPHLYTNLGSLFKEQGRLKPAIDMYLNAVKCDAGFDTALGNLAAAYQDNGQTSLAIQYYKKAVAANPGFAEAICGLANCLSTICSWAGRGKSPQELCGVDDDGMVCFDNTPGWITRLIGVINEQLKDGKIWGHGIVYKSPSLAQDITNATGDLDNDIINKLLPYLSPKCQLGGEGTQIVRAIEEATRLCQLRWYLDPDASSDKFPRPKIPPLLHVPAASTVSPFHTFTLPLDREQVLGIAQLTALRISVSTLRQPWMPRHVFKPPKSPGQNGGVLNVGYVSSDFVDHPLAHLMQSVFGLHDTTKVRPICYATTSSDGSSYRHRIEKQALVRDVSNMSTHQVIETILKDNIHILVNLNGYTKGARNDIFAARPVPVQVSLMGYAGTLGAGWIDYIFSDSISSRERQRDSFSEKLIICQPSFFCCDHRQTAPDCFAVRKSVSRAPVGSGKMYEQGSTLSESLSRFHSKVRKPKSPRSCGTGTVASAHKKEDSNIDIQKYALSQLENSPLVDGYSSDDYLYGKKDEWEDSFSRDLDSKMDKRGSDASIEEEGDSTGTPRLPPFDHELSKRAKLRQQIFPDIPKEAVLLGSFNQLYKITPETLFMWLLILQRQPNAYLWLLQFPPAGESKIREMASKWYQGTDDINKRILFTPVTDKNVFVTRSRVCDLFLDTPECNAHTTAADVIWNGTPILTFPKHDHKMSSRVASSIIAASIPHPPSAEAEAMYRDLVVDSNQKYVNNTLSLISEPQLPTLIKYRQLLYSQRETGRLFDTKQWVKKLEEGLWRAWSDWTEGVYEDIVMG
ncbi:Putative UDP-N-acetylglucosamine--peptide N-acetylglucosaminyltransferase SEC [Yarrowia lipolytica]|nr:Putative UDP-N-acetylglucosamine--peptide N-acetylglucosaminyltransferase SEC [Yarrowia lipolytica]